MNIYHQEIGEINMMGLENKTQYSYLEKNNADLKMLTQKIV